MRTPTIGLVLMGFVMSSAVAGQKEILKYTGVVHKDSRGMTVAFPDICKTPSPAAAVPTPYPNVGTSSSDFGKGTKKVKGGGKLLLAEERVRTNQGDREVYRIRLVDKSGRALKLNKSQLIELDDGSFCAVCVNRKGAVTALLKLEALRAKRTKRDQGLPKS
jgi:hypothetical protein